MRGKNGLVGAGAERLESLQGTSGQCSEPQSPGASSAAGAAVKQAALARDDDSSRIYEPRFNARSHRPRGRRRLVATARVGGPPSSAASPRLEGVAVWHGALPEPGRVGEGCTAPERLKPLLRTRNTPPRSSFVVTARVGGSPSSARSHHRRSRGPRSDLIELASGCGSSGRALGATWAAGAAVKQTALARGRTTEVVSTNLCPYERRETMSR